MNANPRNLNEIFCPTVRLVAPLFQRPYVWKLEENWVPLWESLRDAVESTLAGTVRRPHFMGAVVLDQVNSATGTIGAREIIDGQQRLTTLQLLITAAHDVCVKNNQAGLASMFVNFIKNTQISNNPDEEFKVWPTNPDRPHFGKVMKLGSPHDLYAYYGAQTTWVKNGVSEQLGQSNDSDVQSLLAQAAGLTEEDSKAILGSLTKPQQKEARVHLDEMKKVKHQIPRAYLYFFTMLEEWLLVGGTSEIHSRGMALWQAIQNRLVLVVIDLDQQDDAQQIFETMNALGLPLLPADLVKNFLFHEAEKQSLPVEQLHQDYWLTFDDPDSWWRQEVRQGRLKRPRLDLFLQHYLTLITGREVQVTDLFASYRDWAKSNTYTPNALMQEFREYADVYYAFYHASSGSREEAFFERLNALDTTTFYPLLLEVFKRHAKNDAERHEILTIVESYLVRRMICSLTTKNYNRTIVDLLSNLRKSNTFSASEIRNYLNSLPGDSTRWPDDVEFETAWCTRPLYQALSAKRLGMILRALDKGMQTSKNIPYTLSNKFNVDHLMPQSWPKHWPLPGIGSATDETEIRNGLKHTIGNLTILTSKLNISVSNGPWSNKFSAIKQHNTAMLNNSLPTQWDENAIRQRSKDLFAYAKQIWPR